MAKVSTVERKLGIGVVPVNSDKAVIYDQFSTVDDQILATARKLGLGIHPLNSNDTGIIWDEHNKCDVYCFADTYNRLSIAVQYDFKAGYTVSDKGYRKPLSSFLVVSELK